MTFGTYTTFFVIEMVDIEDDVLEKLYKTDAVVARHRSWVEQARINKPHLLDEGVESALIKRSSFGITAWSDFFDELESDLEFQFQDEELTLTTLLHKLTDSQNTDERFELLTILNQGLSGSFAKYSAQTLYVVTGSGAVEDEERSYQHPMV